MNKFKGSLRVKILAWILFIISSTMAVLSFIVVETDIENDSYSASSAIEIATKKFPNINERYSEYSWSMLGNAEDNTQQMYETGFRYGIIKGDSIDDNVDFNNKGSYIDTNFFMDDTGYNIDKNDLYLYKIVCTKVAGITRQTQINYIGPYSSYNGSNNTETTVGGATETWEGLYADAVCYDLVGGIFYYRAEDYYYPVQNVVFYFNNYGYHYLYDFEKGQYKLLSTTYNLDMGDSYDSNLDVEAIEYALSCEENDGYISFDMLYSYNFTCEMWDTITMDSVRPIQGYELTQIYSTAIPESHFIKDLNYYLDENYTLMVKQSQDSITETYWVFSIIPSDVTPKFNSNDYERAMWFVSLFYELRIIGIVMLVVSAIICILSVIYLICDAGYRKGSDTIHLVKFPDKIPFDLWSIVALIVFSILLVCVSESFFNFIDSALSYTRSSNSYPIEMLIISLFGIIVISAFSLWYILGFAVRIKNGKWWHNTICYKLRNLIKNLIINFFQNISLLWKFIAIISALAIIKLVILIGLGRGVLSAFGCIEKIIVYIIVIYLIIQFNELLKASQKLAEGNLSYKVDTSKMLFEFEEHGNNLNKISEGMTKAVEERMKSERFKTELITNVSHDIKTPLTSIINYVDLLEKEELNNDKATEYLEVLDRQSSKLKKLIEDLVEASKASSGNLPVNLEKLDVGVFLTQTVGEFEEKLSIAGIELIIKKPEEPVFIMADGRHLWRIVDNLMNNICKYAQPQSRVYVNLEADANVHITFRNISKYQLNVTGDELMERFVRGDKSRNTEGHGLGLSIAQSLVTLINGKMEIVVDGDLFKVVIEFDKIDN
jgi:signal transduction histidine kinase